MTTPTSTHLCWICDKPINVAKCNIDEYGEVVHETCYVARMALENGAREAGLSPQHECVSEQGA